MQCSYFLREMLVWYDKSRLHTYEIVASWEPEEGRFQVRKSLGNPSGISNQLDRGKHRTCTRSIRRPFGLLLKVGGNSENKEKKIVSPDAASPSSVNMKELPVFGALEVGVSVTKN